MTRGGGGASVAEPPLGRRSRSALAGMERPGLLGLSRRTERRATPPRRRRRRRLGASFIQPLIRPGDPGGRGRRRPALVWPSAARRAKRPRRATRARPPSGGARRRPPRAGEGAAARARPWAPRRARTRRRARRAPPPWGRRRAAAAPPSATCMKIDQSVVTRAYNFDFHTPSEHASPQEHWPRRNVWAGRPPSLTWIGRSTPADAALKKPWQSAHILKLTSTRSSASPYKFIF